MAHPDTPEKPYYHHSVCDAMIWSYLQGDVDPGIALLVATHADLCPEMRKRLKEINSCAAVALENVQPEPMKCSAQAFFEQRCCGRKMVDKISTSAASDVPAALQKFIGTSFENVSWCSVLPGLQRKTLKLRGSKASVQLFKVAAGKKIPEHSHSGDELTLILKGILQDGTEKYTLGEVSYYPADATRTHAPVAVEECICLAVTTGPRHLPGILGKIINPFLAWAY